MTPAGTRLPLGRRCVAYGGVCPRVEGRTRTLQRVGICHKKTQKGFTTDNSSHMRFVSLESQRFWRTLFQLSACHVQMTSHLARACRAGDLGTHMSGLSLSIQRQTQVQLLQTFADERPRMDVPQDIAALVTWSAFRFLAHTKGAMWCRTQIRSGNAASQDSGPVLRHAQPPPPPTQLFFAPDLRCRLQPSKISGALHTPSASYQSQSQSTCSCRPDWH